jgi:hypothetical protein
VTVTIEATHRGADDRAVQDPDEEEVTLHLKFPRDNEARDISGRRIRENGAPERGDKRLVALLVGTDFQVVGHRLRLPLASP